MSFDIREFTDRLCGFPSTAGNEEPAALWVRDRLADLGFETYEWAADGDLLAGHPSFPDDPTEVDTDGRYSVAGALALGDATLDGDDDYPTLVLNGHIDVVPAERDAWSGDPFEPTRRTTADGTETLTARGAADMKSAVAACVGAALDVRDRVENGELELDGRIVVEAVAGEEDGGYGAATAALRNPYPFDRDAAIVAEPTHLRPVVATEGCLMKRLELTGRSAHAATRWVGEDVLPRFERIRAAFTDLESERATAVTHPLYGEYPIPWPVVCGRVEAGSWASSVPAALWAEFRIGVAPGETVDEVEAGFEDRLAETIADDQWLRDHPPRFERFSVQFEPAEIDPDEPVVTALREGMAAAGVPDAEPEGRTYGADSRHYIEAGIPAVVFGPGRIEQAHFPDETIEWAQVETARETFVEAAAAFLN